MRTACVIALSAFLAARGFAQTSTNVSPTTNTTTNKENSLLVCGLLLGIALTAGGATLYIWHQSQYCCAKHTVVLEKSTDCGSSWTAISTNTLNVCTKKSELFTDPNYDELAWYRLQDKGIVQ